MTTLRIDYFAQLRELAGTASEACETAHATPGPLYEELRARHGFPFKPSQLRVAVNDAFVPWEHPLADGDVVVFIPPVTGG
ncbi:MoaD/ThiS family protein [Oecophyllibacter saccharovorans]|uniref:MoaD/ThiS family protein n=1 Tax=Oecophyllibacter saccharovorans TaxID=2558360 RepID=UPI001143F8FD|nr:MoaD/ThiS family protein [Oecophyllibacter saccharovorans]QDH15383.1 MoaD/ThiS family protein [Oecophyllibacter saccharovorans]